MCAVCIPEGSAGSARRLRSARSHPCAPTFSPNSFRLIQFRKNVSANPLESHTFKTKDLKPFRFIHFQKKGRGWAPLSNLQLHTSNLRSSLTPLDSALTSKRASKSFTSNTYEKHTQGEGGYLEGSVIPTWHLPRAERGASGGISLRLPPVTPQQSPAIPVCFQLSTVGYGVSTIFPNWSRRSRIS